MTDYSPSPELVEAARNAAEFFAERGDDWMEAGLIEAVAYRTPSGDPELVPWVEVEALIEAARNALQYSWAFAVYTRPDVPPLRVARGDLAAALAPFKDEK